MVIGISFPQADLASGGCERDQARVMLDGMQQDDPVVVRATATDSHTITSVLSVGFMQDPMHRWLFPDETERARLHPAFFAPLAAMALKDGEVWTTEDRSCAALWLPFDAAAADHGPGFRELFEPTLGTGYAARLGEFDRQSAEIHPTDRDHWYLAFIVVCPGMRGRGIGTALLRHRLAILDREGTPAYLEATNLDSERLYQRFGFTRGDRTIDMPEGPSLYPMWREPHRPAI
jgi:GNAT superfamily N-acetyltransferase